jgi:hypothetical protein
MTAMMAWWCVDVLWCHRDLLDLYRVYPHVDAGANVTVQCLWLTIKRMIERGSTSSKTLFVQLDGASDNACVTVRRYCAWVVQQGWYWEVCVTEMLSQCDASSRPLTLSTPAAQVIVARLPVGHTHEDIDQRFSIVSRVSVRP